VPRSPRIALGAIVALGMGACGSPDQTPEPGPSQPEADATVAVPAPAPPQPGDPAASEVTFQSLDGKHTFGVPREDDPEWEDYQAMRRHPRYRSSLDNNPMYQPPYDPEWRSTVTGVREAPPVDQELRNAHDSLGELAQSILAAVGEKDFDRLHGMSVDRDEFEEICWPSFPQSRPYAKVPVAEAWHFHNGHCTGGIQEMLRQQGGRSLVLDTVAHGEGKDYGNFRLYNDVVIHAIDASTREKVEIPHMQAVIERNGRYKPFIYKD